MPQHGAPNESTFLIPSYILDSVKGWARKNEITISGIMGEGDRYFVGGKGTPYSVPTGYNRLTITPKLSPEIWESLCLHVNTSLNQEVLKVSEYPTG